VRLAAIDYRPRGITNSRVGVILSCTHDRSTGPLITIQKSCQDGNRSMANLCTGIAAQDLDNVADNVGDANGFGSAPLARETVQSDFAYRWDRVA
jgi:hypothetical protein